MNPLLDKVFQELHVEEVYKHIYIYIYIYIINYLYRFDYFHKHDCLLQTLRQSIIIKYHHSWCGIIFKEPQMPIGTAFEDQKSPAHLLAYRLCLLISGSFIVFS